MSEHLFEKYNLYAVHFENGMHKNMLLVHVARPLSFSTFVRQYLLDNVELTVVKTNQKFETSQITGVQKIPNENVPAWEITLSGQLIEIPR